MRKLKCLTALVLGSTFFVSSAAMAQQAAVAPMTAVANPVAVTPKAVITTVVATPGFSASQKVLIDQQIHAYLLAHPEILIEMSQKLQTQQQQQQTAKASKVIVSNVLLLAHDPQSPVAGNVQGTVTVVEFFDYQCPHCKSMVPAIDALILANKNVKVVYKEMPIFGPESEFASKAALASVAQGKYGVFHHALMQTQGRLNNQQVLDIAKSVGIDINKLQAVMNSAEIAKELQQTGQLAQEMGLPGTPAFVVLTEKAGKVDFRFIPGQTDQASLQKAVNEVSGKN